MPLKVRRCTYPTVEQRPLDFGRAEREQRRLEPEKPISLLAWKHEISTMELKNFIARGWSIQKIDELLSAVGEVMANCSLAGPAAKRAVPEMVPAGLRDHQIVQIITAVNLFYVGFKNSEAEAVRILDDLPAAARGLLHLGRSPLDIHDLITDALRKNWQNDGFSPLDLVEMARIRMTDEEIIGYFELPRTEVLH